MKRALLVLAMLVVTASAYPAPRRRPVAPVLIENTLAVCASGTVLRVAHPLEVAVDDKYVYFADTDGSLQRVNKRGGYPTTLVRLPGITVGLITLDATRVYFEGINVAGVSSIYAVGKSGGAAAALASGVMNPWEITNDASYVYVVSTGTSAGQIPLADGAIVRVKKDGSEVRQLATALSGPFGLAVSGSDVFFTESGLAADSRSAGVRRVSIDGGTISHLVDDVAVTTVAVDAMNVYFDANDITSGTAFVKSVPRSGGEVARVASAGAVFDLEVRGENLYFVDVPAGSDPATKIARVPVAGGSLTTIANDAGFLRLALDECLVYYGAANSLERKTR